MVNLEPRAARFLLRKSALLNQQLLNLINVRLFFDCQKNIAVNHSDVSVVNLNIESVNSCRGGRSTGWWFALASSNVTSTRLSIFVS